MNTATQHANHTQHDLTCLHTYPMCKGGCGHEVEQLYDRYYITMGHAGYNNKTNNGKGYTTAAAAKKAHDKYYAF